MVKVVDDLNIEISNKISKHFEIKLGINIVKNVEVKRDEKRTLELLIKVLDELKNIKLEELKNHPIIRAYRDFYWRIGIDPTKQRPSSEALVRRVLKSGKMPIINNVVDAGNIASIRTLTPIGLYNVGSIRGNVVLRFAKNGELFEPIGSKTEKLKENQIVLADDVGILHVFPHRDSKRTMIKKDTKDVLVVACGVPNISYEYIKQAADTVTHYIVKLSGGGALFRSSQVIS